MPIDKIIPSALNTSSDERLVKATEMTDALNVTVSTDSEGDGFVLKNAKGNVYIAAKSGSELDNSFTYKVLGSITDYDEEFVYFFVKCVSASGYDGIYRASVTQDSNYFEAVFVGSATFDLEFPEDGYVDAAITRIDVNQDGSMNTLIYFTDNHNEPRKVNVQRAMADGTFTDYVAEDYEEFFAVCKTAPKGILTANLNSNTNIDSNSLYGKSYSFCYQYVYKDGEVSAMSNLSSPMVCGYVLDGAKDDGKAIDSEDNEIFVFLKKGNKEVSHVNVFFRDNYTQQFYKIGRFPATESLTKDSQGDQWNYNDSTANHKLTFRGNSSYTPISNREALKDFDNVPHKAASVCIANNRLFFGNYTDSYPSTPVKATLTVLYDNLPTTSLTLDNYRSWKAGVTHNFGIVFYDKKGRSGPVNDIGSVYVKTIGERSAESENLGRAKIQVSIDDNQTAPSWAVQYSIVYGGNNDMSTFKQYSVADGFASWFIEASYDDGGSTELNSILNNGEHTDNIFVSLKSWSGSKVSYVGSTEADHEYKYRKGDILKVLRYTDSYTGQVPTYAYPDIETKVVNKSHLLADMSDTATAEAIQAQINAINDSNQVDSVSDYYRRLINAITNSDLEVDQDRLNELEAELEREISAAKFTDGLTNPIFNGNYAPCKGHFLEVSDVDEEDWSSSDYEGHIQPNGDPISGGSHTTDPHFHPIPNWRRNVLVEIFSPKKYTERKVYKELNIFQSTTNFTSGYSFLLTDGDVFLKKTRVVFSQAIDSNSDNALDDFSSRNLSSYSFKDEYLESEHASHFFHSKAIDHGHVKLVNEDAATVSRTASITYSDYQANDSKIIKFSSFYLSDGNYTDMPYKYGQIDRLIEEDGYMFVLQDSKVGKIPINKQVLTTGDGNSIVSLSKNILGEPVYYGGDYGSSGYPQAVVYRDGRIFFFDITSEKIVRTGGDGLTVISDLGLDSFLQSKLSEVKKAVFDDSEESGVVRPRILGGYDPDYDEYLITITDCAYYSPKANAAVPVSGFTAAFNSPAKAWTSFYSFKPTCYASIGDSLISCSQSGSSLFWIHADEPQSAGAIDQPVTRARYYGTSYSSVVEVISSFNPSMTKVFEALSLESDTSNFDAVLTTSDQRTDINDWVVKERGRYAEIPRDLSDVFVNIGVLSANVTDSEILNFNNRVTSQPIPKGSDVYIDGVNTDRTVSSISGSRQITLSDDVTATAGDVVTIKLDSAANGDPLRDYFCRVRLTNQVNTAFELFAVNVYYDRSMLGQEKGQR